MVPEWVVGPHHAGTYGTESPECERISTPPLPCPPEPQAPPLLASATCSNDPREAWAITSPRSGLDRDRPALEASSSPLRWNPAERRSPAEWSLKGPTAAPTPLRLAVQEIPARSMGTRDGPPASRNWTGERRLAAPSLRPAPARPPSQVQASLARPGAGSRRVLGLALRVEVPRSRLHFEASARRSLHHSGSRSHLLPRSPNARGAAAGPQQFPRPASRPNVTSFSDHDLFRSTAFRPLPRSQRLGPQQGLRRSTPFRVADSLCSERYRCASHRERQASRSRPL